MSVFDPLTTQRLAEPIVDIYKAIEDDLLLSIAKRLAKNLDITDTAKWELKMLAQMGALTRDSIKIIVSHNKDVPEQLRNALENAAERTIETLEPGFKKLAKEGYAKNIKIPPSKSVDRAVNAYHGQALDSLNMVNTVMSYKVKPAWTTLIKNIRKYIDDDIERQGTLDILNKHTGAVVIGTETRQQAVRKAIDEMLGNGIPAFVDKAGREWSPEAYVNMDIRTTVSNTAHQAQFNRMDDYGLNFIEVSSHAGARPKCAKDQGKIYDRNNSKGKIEDLYGNMIEYYPWSSSSYGDPDGILGINCGHHVDVFTPGFSAQTYFPTEDPEENDRLYKISQKQRALERKIRKSKQECMVYSELGDEEAYKKAAIRLDKANKNLGEFIENTGRTRRRGREQVTGWSSGAARKAANTSKMAAIDKAQNGGIIKTNKAFAKIANTVNIPVTDEGIQNVKMPKCVRLSKAQNEDLQNHCKALLKNVQSKKLGTEACMTLSMKAKKLHSIIGEEGAEWVQRIVENQPYIFIHNHPDCNIFSEFDIRNFIEDSNMRILTAVGHDGSLYMVEKAKGYDKFKLDKFFRNELSLNSNRMNSPQDYVDFMEKLVEGMKKFGCNTQND